MVINLDLSKFFKKDKEGKETGELDEEKLGFVNAMMSNPAPIVTGGAGKRPTALPRRRAKNRVAKQSRKRNRG